MKPTLILTLAACALVGCSDPAAPRSDALVFDLSEDGMMLTNTSDADLFYQAVNANLLALWQGPAEVTACTEPDCPHLGPEESVFIPWTQVAGWSPDLVRVRVGWWRVTPQGSDGWVRSDDQVFQRDLDVPDQD